jgi:hypothetical protein
MPFSFHVDESAGVFHIRAFRKVDDAQVIAFYERLLQESAFTSGRPVLCDCSTLTAASISATLIESLAKRLRSRTHLVAIIAPRASVFGLARMYQIFCDPMDERIHVFAESKEAVAWLHNALSASATEDRPITSPQSRSAA